MTPLQLFNDIPVKSVTPFRTQLLKWVGNKQRFADEIVSYFPNDLRCYYEPFLGSGAVMATLAPNRGFGGDVFPPLVEIWQTLKRDPNGLKQWYRERWERFTSGDKAERYGEIRERYNKEPNAADLLFLCRSCYGGVVRFRKDGYMSTPCGVHDPISPESFGKRVDIWALRVKGCTFELCDYRQMMARAQRGDLIYCDPPYTFTQSILYGAQSFSLEDLFKSINECRTRGVRVALSIDGSKRSGAVTCDINPPAGLFEREVFVHCGRSMLRRFQMEGKTLENEVVADRLLLTY